MENEAILLITSGSSGNDGALKSAPPEKSWDSSLSSEPSEGSLLSASSNVEAPSNNALPLLIDVAGSAPTVFPRGPRSIELSTDEDWDDEMEDGDYLEEAYDAYLLARAARSLTLGTLEELPTDAAQVGAVLNPAIDNLPTYGKHVGGVGATAASAPVSAAASRSTSTKATSSSAIVKGSKAGNEVKELATKIRSQMLRIRNKFGTPAWNESDGEELNRVYQYGPALNNCTRENWVQSMNLLNLYKSAVFVARVPEPEPVVDEYEDTDKDEEDETTVAQTQTVQAEANNNKQ